MSGHSGGTPDKGFQDRIHRMQERRAPIEAARPKVDVLPDWRENVRYPATLVGMTFLGMFAVFFVRFARFHLMGGTLVGDAPDITMIIDAVLAGVAALVIFTAIGLTARDQNRAEGQSVFSFQNLSNNPVKAALVVGIAIMIGVMHNMVHSMPKAFGLIFSPEWTEEVIAYSEPGSIYYRGNYYVVFPQAESLAEDVQPEPGAEGAPVEEEKKALPKVRRL